MKNKCHIICVTRTYLYAQDVPSFSIDIVLRWNCQRATIKSVVSCFLRSLSKSLKKIINTFKAQESKGFLLLTCQLRNKMMIRMMPNQGPLLDPAAATLALCHHDQLIAIVRPSMVERDAEKRYIYDSATHIFLPKTMGPFLPISRPAQLPQDYNTLLLGFPVKRGGPPRAAGKGFSHNPRSLVSWEKKGHIAL